MNSSLLLTSLLMGVFGGPHCLAMCGAACVALKNPSSKGAPNKLGFFLLGRLLGYASLGALAAISVQGLGWLSIHSSVFRPLWGLFHVAAFFVGLVLIWRADQPIWLNTFAKEVWGRVSQHPWVGLSASPQLSTFMLGFVWALLPCGLLYSAVWVAALSANAFEGALVMSSFALGSASVLVLGPVIWRVIRTAPNLVLHQRVIHFKRSNLIGGMNYESHSNSSKTFKLFRQELGVRIAGLSLVVVSVYDLWQGLVQDKAPWCVSALVR